MRTYGDLRNGIGTYTLANGSKRYRVVYRVNGQVRSKGGFRDKAGARHWQTQNAADVDTGTWIDPCNVKGAGKEDLADLRCPSAEDVMRLADAVRVDYPQYRAMVLVAGWGGLRFGEVTALKRRHVVIAQGCVHVRAQATETKG